MDHYHDRSFISSKQDEIKRVCPNCGAVFSDRNPMDFCSKCGKSMKIKERFPGFKMQRSHVTDSDLRKRKVIEKYCGNCEHYDGVVDRPTMEKRDKNYSSTSALYEKACLKHEYILCNKMSGPGWPICDDWKKNHSLTNIDRGFWAIVLQILFGVLGLVMLLIWAWPFMADNHIVSATIFYFVAFVISFTLKHAP